MLTYFTSDTLAWLPCYFAIAKYTLRRSIPFRPPSVPNAPQPRQTMMPKSGNRFSDDIMVRLFILPQVCDAK